MLLRDKANLVLRAANSAYEMGDEAKGEALDAEHQALMIENENRLEKVHQDLNPYEDTEAYLHALENTCAVAENGNYLNCEFWELILQTTKELLSAGE